MPNKISLSLLKQVDRELYEQTTSRFVENEDLLLLIKTAIQEKIDEALSRQRSTTSYQNPSWGFYQADLLGYQRALIEISDLITIKQE